MTFEAEITRLQQILAEIAKTIQQVTALIEIPDTWIDAVLDLQAPAEVPTTSTTIAAVSMAESARYAATIQAAQTELRAFSNEWLHWIDTETQRILATAAETPVVTSPTHKVMQRITVTKPPPTIPAVVYDQLLSLADILYYIIVAALSGEVEMRTVDIDRYIDDFIKIVEVISKVSRGG